MHGDLAMGICSGSGVHGDTSYGDVDPHTECQQVKQWLPARHPAAQTAALTMEGHPLHPLHQMLHLPPH
eukprot:356866-Chlamydomonas_euryale.AAC.3